MRVAIRQGILSAPTVASAPEFLVSRPLSVQPGDPPACAIDIVINNVPVVFTFAHGSANYMASEQSSVLAAWGPFSGSTVHYLYWELNIQTGRLTYGSTTLPPVISSGEPLNPQIGQMWFDPTLAIMRVWTAANSGDKWQDCIRVMAGTASYNLGPFEENVGSQAGLDGNFESGFVLRDGTDRPIRITTNPNTGAQFKFLTTADELVTTGNTGSVVKLENSAMYVRAGEEIPAFYVVYVYAIDIPSQTTELFCGLASSDPSTYVEKSPVGLVNIRLDQGMVGTLLTGGIIYNDQWQWTAPQVGKSVYVGDFGEITATRPGTLKAKRVGTILSPKEIVLQFDWETDFGGVGEQGPAGTSGYSGYSGATGTSGFSGFSGLNGGVAASGYSGVNGTSGFSGYSGTNGTNGASGYSGVATSGFSGYSGISPPANIGIHNYSADRILDLTDVNCMVRMSVGSANTVTVPPDSDVAWALGDTIIISQIGTGVTTIVAGLGVTINTPLTLALGMRYGKVTITRVGANEWDLEGNLAQV